MTEERVSTRLETDQGPLAFQEYFVREACRPAVRAICYLGADSAAPTPQLLAAAQCPMLAGIVICPSNPWLSIDPLLAVPGLRSALLASGVPVIAVSPLIAGAAVKGPTAKIMAELGLERDVAAIAAHYQGLIDGLIIDTKDRAAAAGLALPVLVTNTLMRG